MARRSTAAAATSVLVNAARSRIARRGVERELARRGPAAPGTYRVAVHFPDFPVNLYQLRQWYAPLERLAEELPVVVVARYARTAQHLLRECPLPVVLCGRIRDVEQLLAEHPIRLVLYVNQNMRNFSVLRYREPAHVFVSHGESDKDYMASNQLKAYDRTFVAGPAAIDRLRRLLLDYDVDGRTVLIGRPQVDVDHPGPVLPDDGRRVVLYAPTWEGDRPSMSYSSVASHGEAAVAALLTDPGVRVVFRPHPRTGTSDPAAAAAVHRISERLRLANRADPGARHVDDRGTPFGWHLRACDACVTDVSAVAYDWLATGKPLVVTRPAAPEAVLDTSALVTTLDLLPAEDAATVGDRLRAAQDPAGRELLLGLARHYYGDVRPGSSMARFLAAARAVVAERDAVLAARAAATTLPDGA